MIGPTPRRITVARAIRTSRTQAEALAKIRACELFEDDSDAAVLDYLRETEEIGGHEYGSDAGPFLRRTLGEPEVEALNREWFVVNEGGRVVVAHMVADPIGKGRTRERMERMSFADFSRLMQRTRVGKDTLGDAWLSWEGRRQFERVVFDPENEHPPTVLNLWKGWAIQPAPGGDWSAIRHHIEDVICSGVAEHSRYLMGWLASFLQNPGQRAEVVVVLRGPEGAGKSAFGALIRRMAGQHGMLVSSPSHVVGHFNAHQRDLVFLEASEAMFAGDRAAASKLKSMVTDEMLVIEGKGRDVVMATNRLSFLMTTNEEWCVPAGPESRRYFVLDVPGCHRGEQGYFDKLWGEINSDASVAALMYDLMAMDLAGFSVRKFPETDALLEQREHSIHGVPAWLADYAERAIDRQVVWGESASTVDLHRDYSGWVAGQRYERALHVIPFARTLARVGLEKRRTPGRNGFWLPGPREVIALVRKAAGLGPGDLEEESQEGEGRERIEAPFEDDLEAA